MKRVDKSSRGRLASAPGRPRERPGSGTTEMQLAHALLAPLLRTILRNRAGALAGTGPRPLHDIRVAMRRCRAVLRLLRGPLRPTGAATVDRGLKELAEALSGPRDTQVWLAFLASPDVRERCAQWAGWAAFMRRQKADGVVRHNELRGILTGPAFFQPMDALAEFVDGELPRLVGSAADRPARPYVARRLRRLYASILKEGKLPRDAGAERVHEVRKRTRRARYWADFCTPLFGKQIAELAVRMKAHADCLGGLHDMDVHAARLAQAGGEAPRRLVRLIEIRRRKSLRREERTWRALSSAKLRRSVRRCLAVSPAQPSGRFTSAFSSRFMMTSSSHSQASR